MTKQMLVVLALFLYVAVVSLIVEPSSLVVHEYDIEDKDLYGIKLVFASDFHLKPKDHKKLDKIVKLINKQNADIAFIGGDILTGNNRKKTLDVASAAQKLSLIKAPTYVVMGENDYLASGEELVNSLTYNRVKVLRNSNTKVSTKGRFISIIGIDDISTHGADVPSAFYGTRPPRIVLTHNPDVYYDIADRANLILAGHTHGGQFLLPFSPPVFVPSKYGGDFASGLITKTNNKMIITRGIGTSFLPVRFNCKPEIVVVNFIPYGSKKTK